jgi:hypothetical protein
MSEKATLTTIAGAPIGDLRVAESPLKLSGDAARYNHRDGNDDFRQAGDLFCLIGKVACQRLVNNIVEAMQGVPREIVERQLGHCAKATRAMPKESHTHSGLRCGGRRSKSRISGAGVRHAHPMFRQTPNRQYLDNEPATCAAGATIKID